MRTVHTLYLLLVIAGCSRDRTPGAPSSFAGNWQIRSERAPGDTVVGYKLTATNDTSGWTLQFPGRDPLRVAITLAGDSAVGEVETYESVLRPGVQVRTSFVLRLRDDRLEGTTVARYAMNGPDSMLILKNVGVRVP